MLQTEKSSRLTAKMMTFLEEVCSLEQGIPLLAGLPAGAVRNANGRLALAATCCTVRLFERQMMTVASALNVDVLVMRHGLHPEVLDNVRYDVALRGQSKVHLMVDMLLYFHADHGFWLVPSAQGPYIAIEPDGLQLTHEPPFVTWAERADGLCRAAKMTVHAAAGKAANHG